MSSAITVRPDRRQGSAAILLRLVLWRNEVFRLSPESRGVRVLAGRAWVTYAGQDLILGRGDEVSITPGGDFALLSALGRRPLIVEILGAGRPQARPAVLAV